MIAVSNRAGQAGIVVVYVKLSKKSFSVSFGRDDIFSVYLNLNLTENRFLLSVKVREAM